VKNTLSKFFIFATGAIVGSVVTWRVLKPYYEKLANEEIESVKETFRERYKDDDEDISKDENPANPVETTPSLEDLKKEYKQLTADYTDNEEVTDLSKRPYIISPEDFGERTGYDAETLTYYADGVLTYDTGEPVDDVDDVVGLGFETHFGEYEDDSVHVRNEKYETDYEILRDLQNYSDVINTNPHQAEDE
jgi:hypothetical protein